MKHLNPLLILHFKASTTHFKSVPFFTPVCHHLLMTLENIHTLQFILKKDYQTNKLVTELYYRMPPDTHLVLDETAKKDGKL